MAREYLIPGGLIDESGSRQYVTSGGLTSETATSGITASGAVTFGALTSAGTSQLRITAAGSVTFGILTSSSASTLLIQGQGAASFGAMTSSGVGALKITGSATVTFGQLTGSGAASLKITGNAAVTFGVMLASSASNLRITGQGDVTLGDMTGAGASALRITANAAVTFGTLVGTGASTISAPHIVGVGSVTFGAMIGSGTFLIRASATLPKDEVTENIPFPITPPSQDVSPELYGFLKDTLAQVRDAHVKNQLGDSTFNWQVMLALDEIPSHTLGSSGSFYHDTYGIFRGTYVQFESIDSGGMVGGPIGFGKDQWGATNEFGRCRDGICRGLICAESLPLEGQYGWILTQGINFSQLTVDAAIKSKDSLGWTVDGLVEDQNAGTIGQVLVITAGIIPPGGFTLSLSLGAPNLASRTVALESRIADLEAQIQSLVNSGVGTAIDQALTFYADGISTQLTALARRITSITPDGSSIQDTQFLQSLTNLENSALLSRKQALLAQQLGATQLAATVQLTKEAKTGRDESQYYSEASGQFSVEAGLSSINASLSATASAGFSASAGTYADAAGVSATAAVTAQTAAEVARTGSETAATASTTARDASSASATDSAASASASHTSELAAAASASGASGSATASSTSAANASTSESNAYTYSLVAASNQIDLTTLTATVTTQASAITDIEGKQEAYFSVTAIAGDNTASVTILADNSGGRIALVGDVDIHGDLVVDGTIITEKIGSNAVTLMIAAETNPSAISIPHDKPTLGGVYVDGIAITFPTPTGAPIRLDFNCLGQRPLYESGAVIYVRLVRIQSATTTDITGWQEAEKASRVLFLDVPSAGSSCVYQAQYACDFATYDDSAYIFYEILFGMEVKR